MSGISADKSQRIFVGRLRRFGLFRCFGCVGSVVVLGAVAEVWVGCGRWGGGGAACLGRVVVCCVAGRKGEELGLVKGPHPEAAAGWSPVHVRKGGLAGAVDPSPVSSSFLFMVSSVANHVYRSSRGVRGPAIFFHLSFFLIKEKKKKKKPDNERSMGLDLSVDLTIIRQVE